MYLVTALCLLSASAQAEEPSSSTRSWRVAGGAAVEASPSVVSGGLGLRFDLPWLSAEVQATAYRQPTAELEPVLQEITGAVELPGWWGRRGWGTLAWSGLDGHLLLGARVAGDQAFPRPAHSALVNQLHVEPDFAGYLLAGPTIGGRYATPDGRIEGRLDLWVLRGVALIGRSDYLDPSWTTHAHLGPRVGGGAALTLHHGWLFGTLHANLDWIPAAPWERQETARRGEPTPPAAWSPWLAATAGVAF